MQKPQVVLDSSTVVSGIGWRGESRQVLRLLAARAFTSHCTPFLTGEWADVVQRVSDQSRSFSNANWAGWLVWLKSVSQLHADIAPRKTSRDPNDDPVVMAAVVSSARFIVTRDDDLLSLGRPYGVACVTPRQFLAEVLKD